mmetsp:Transcript_30868/g.80497  ORF Transcript_30868/g.80497 Transcript_30868/m.80497 type:complete len:293 (+) Transcript_30868:920-1798(+)
MHWVIAVWPAQQPPRHKNSNFECCNPAPGKPLSIPHPPPPGVQRHSSIAPCNLSDQSRYQPLPHQVQQQSSAPRVSCLAAAFLHRPMQPQQAHHSTNPSNTTSRPSPSPLATPSRPTIPPTQAIPRPGLRHHPTQHPPGQPFHQPKQYHVQAFAITPCNTHQAHHSIISCHTHQSPPTTPRYTPATELCRRYQPHHPLPSPCAESHHRHRTHHLLLPPCAMWLRPDSPDNHAPCVRLRHRRHNDAHALQVPRQDSTMPELRVLPRQAPFFRCIRAAVGPSPASGGKHPRQPR